jgi:FkbH-like protein
LGAGLREAITSAPNSFYVDLDAVFRGIGQDAALHAANWHRGRAPYTASALAKIAAHDFRLIRPQLGRNRKCLVLDCDDVLWGGILGEQGPAGIAIGQNYPGSPYFDFQQELLNLHDRGVILALCSKNDESAVFDILQSHPEMLIRKSHIASHRINWTDKATNLREIAADLNIGIDSLVFVDDSAHEIALVQRELPEVATLHLPSDRPADYSRLLAQEDWFDTLSVTDDDRSRGDRYKVEAKRKTAERGATDLDAFLASLDIEIQVAPAKEVSVARIAQMTQKTNQFNLTTRRYSEPEILRFLDDDNWGVYTLRVRDVFGDSGLVGTANLRYGEDGALIDSLLVSCRVLGRGIEKALLAAVMRHAAGRGAARILGQFIPSLRNDVCAGFLTECGFAPTSGPDNDGQWFERAISGDDHSLDPGHIRLTEEW